jgi:PPK2 family polyphosphate:nucleotide phosphotransferase
MSEQSSDDSSVGGYVLTVEDARDIENKEAKRIGKRIRQRLRVEPGTPAGLDDRDPAWNGGPELEDLSAAELKLAARERLAAGVEQLAEAQELLWASGTHALLVVFQAMDAAGKDSTIKHVTSGVNPQGVNVVSFKQPSSEELAHSYLWRVSNAAPARGRIVIFNRSHYEEVVALRVHPEWLDRQNLPRKPGKDIWQKRYDDINAFEHHLHRNGTRIVKFFLHVSKGEQKKRFLSRLETPEKRWKFSVHDVAERQLFAKYMDAYESALTATSTRWAPWYVIPADHKPVMQAMVIGVLLDTIRDLDLKWPEVSPEEFRLQEAAQHTLEAERDD